MQIFDSSMSAMKYTILLLSILFACNTSSTKNRLEEKEIKINKPSISYDTMLIRVNDLKKECQHLNPNQAGIMFSNFVDSNLFPYWYGTPWDYNGVTQTPNDGYIACGYFVTTILRDMQVNIHRVKMAQCASEQMINSLTNKKANYSRLPFQSFIEKVKQNGKGLSIIGLDNHTGFLYHDGEELYFIHSSYVGTGRVIKEIAQDNSILQNSNYKVVGYISQDAQFIKKWLTFKP